MTETFVHEISQITRNGASPLSLADRAYQLILDQMLRGSLPLGSPLSRRQLADQFQMTMVPVGQALQRLEIEGLLESRPRAGTRVKVPNAEEIREHFELRQALECQSARLCAERATFEERLELARFAANVDALYGKVTFQGDDAEGLFAVNKYHEDLHMRIAEYARSGSLRSQIEKSHVLIFNWLYDVTQGQQPLVTHSHRDLIDVIVRGNPLEADMAMREHVISGLTSIQRAIQPLHRDDWRAKRRPRLGEPNHSNGPKSDR